MRRLGGRMMRVGRLMVRVRRGGSRLGKVIARCVVLRCVRRIGRGPRVRRAVWLLRLCIVIRCRCVYVIRRIVVLGLIG